MHEHLDNRGVRYTLASVGFIASLIFLAASATANWRYAFSLARTPVDGYLYGAAAAASDVFMAAAPFYYRASMDAKKYLPAFAAILIWLVTTLFAAQAVISHASANRLDAASTRASKQTSYADTRAELEKARKDLGFVPTHRPADTVKADILGAQAKNQSLWFASEECTAPTGRAAKEFCQAHFKLNAELAAANQATKLDDRIAELIQKSEKTAETGQAVISEADPGAKSMALMSGFDVRQVQTFSIFMVAFVILCGAGLGPYMCAPTLYKRRVALPHVIEGEATDITPEPEPIRLEVAPLAIAAPPRPKASKVEAQPPVDAAPEWMALLTALGFPETGWQPPRDQRGDFVLRKKDTPEVTAWRFFTYAQAHSLTGEFSPDQIDEAIAKFAKIDFREEIGSRVVKPELEKIRRWVKKDGSPVVWVIKPAPVAAVKQMLVNRKMLPEEQPAEAPQDTPVTVTATQAASEDAKPNGIKAIALRKFFRGTDPASETDVTLN